MGIINLFPTPVYREPATLSNYDPVQLEIKECLEYIKNSGDLKDVSHIHKEAGILKKQRLDFGYFINDHLIKNHNLTKLENRIYEALNKYLSYVNWSALVENDPVVPKKNGSEFIIMNSWINIAKMGVKHDYHTHPGYLIAGVYYFRVSEKQSGINFNNPNLMMYNCNFPEGNLSPQSIELIPNDGDIILFPAWLQHGTHENESDEERISIAFNINFVSQTQT